MGLAAARGHFETTCAKATCGTSSPLKYVPKQTHNVWFFNLLQTGFRRFSEVFVAVDALADVNNGTLKR